MDVLSLVVGVFIGWVTMFGVIMILGAHWQRQARAKALAQKEKLAESLQKLQQVREQMGVMDAKTASKTRGRFVQ